MANTTPPIAERRLKGWLEAEVQRVTDDYVTGKFTLAEGELLTPHRISKRIAEMDPNATKASPGAITNTLVSWGAIGFAEINDKPVAFVDYTDQARQHGLLVMKEAANTQLKEERAAARAETKEAKEAAAAKEARAAERAAKKVAREQAAAEKAALKEQAAAEKAALKEAAKAAASAASAA